MDDGGNSFPREQLRYLHDRPAVWFRSCILIVCKNYYRHVRGDQLIQYIQVILRETIRLSVIQNLSDIVGEGVWRHRCQVIGLDDLVPIRTENDAEDLPDSGGPTCHENGSIFRLVHRTGPVKRVGYFGRSTWQCRFSWSHLSLYASLFGSHRLGHFPCNCISRAREPQHVAGRRLAACERAPQTLNQIRPPDKRQQ